jgi:hypothetical protein
MLTELETLEVRSATFESRGPADDRRDRGMLDAMHSQKLLGPSLRMNHVAGPHDPLLWIPYAVCGTVTQHRTGTPEYLDALHAQAVIQITEITVPS